MINLNSNDIRYIVEYWERDSLDIDDNQHILFVLSGQQRDIIVTKENIESINHFLSAIGKASNEKIKIALEARVDFFDRVIYPTKFYGEQFFQYKNGGIIHFIRKMLGLSMPLVVREKWRPITIKKHSRKQNT